MVALLHLIIHVLIYSGSGLVLYSLRRRASLIPIYVHLGILLVFTSMMSSFYILEITEGIEVGGGSIAYAAVLWTVLFVYIMERDLSAIKLLILGILAVQFVFLFSYPYFGYLLSYEGVTNPLAIPSELFNVSFGIFWVGNILALLEMVVMIFFVERIRERLTSIPLWIIVSGVYILTLILDGVLYPIFAYPVTQSISIVQGISSLLSKILLGLAYSLMFSVGITLLKPSSGWSKDKKHLTLGDMISMPKTKVIDAWEKVVKNQKMVSLLLRILGHDIRNYNSMTISALEALQLEHPDLDGDVQTMLAEIEKLQYQSTELLSNTVTLGALQGGDIEVIAIELKKKLNEAKARVDISYPDIHVELVGGKSLDGAYVLGNELIDVALYNILSNMVKHRKPSQSKVFVDVESEINSGFLHLILSDHGVGIPDHRKESIFDSIEARPRNSDFGLFLVRRILSLADAKIHVRNRPDSPDDHNKGTSFHLRFPLSEAC